jgi:hypothetical protein
LGEHHLQRFAWSFYKTFEIQSRTLGFGLWAVNPGVFDHGHTSLGYHLQDVPEAAELVEDLLADLTEQLEILLQLGDHGLGPDDATYQSLSCDITTDSKH